MNVKLPRIINDYVKASNAHDVKSILSCFSDDASVRDEGKELRGKEKIGGWIAETIEKYKFQFKPLSIKEDRRRSDGGIGNVRWKSGHPRLSLHH